MTRILIVADDLAERRRATSALALDPDCQVVEVPNGPAAAALLRGETFDVLVVDGDMDHKGGFSWLYELREEAAQAGGRRPPAIVLTSRVDDQFLADWSGAEATVRKPADGFEVRRHVAALTSPAPAA